MQLSALRRLFLEDVGGKAWSQGQRASFHYRHTHYIAYADLKAGELHWWYMLRVSRYVIPGIISFPCSQHFLDGEEINPYANRGRLWSCPGGIDSSRRGYYESQTEPFFEIRLM
jgi:hypothetical protein